MRILILAGMLAASCLCAKEPSGQPHNAMIFVDATDGFDVYLSAALEKQHVPVTVTTDRNQADYEVGTTHDGREAGIKLVELRSQRVVFAYAVDRKSAGKAEEEAATVFARRLAAALKQPARKTPSKLASALAGDPAFDF